MSRTFEKKSFPRMARDLKTMYEKGTVSFNNAIQRTFVWKNTAKDNRMSLLVDSMLRGLPIPPMYANKNTSTGVIDFLDGKQRSLTIIKFLNDEFSLTGLDTFDDENGNEVDINGLKFSELPEEMRDSFRTYSLIVYYYEDMTEDEVAEMFSRLNHGVILKSIEKIRAESKSFNTIRDIASHPVFETMLSSASIASYGNEDIAIKSWIMLNSEKPCLDTKEVRPIMKNTVITDDEAMEIKSIYDRISEVHTMILNNDTINEKLKKKIAKRIYTKTHFVSIIPIMKRAVEDGRLNKEIADFLVKFFSGGRSATINEEYNAASGSGSGHAESVRMRLNALSDEYNKFFSVEIEKESEDIENLEDFEEEFLEDIFGTEVTKVEETTEEEKKEDVEEEIKTEIEPEKVEE